jgi:hypothetical protein
MTDTYRALCAELVADYDDCHYRSELSDRAHAALDAEPEPEADGEVAELVAWLRCQKGQIPGGYTEFDRRIDRAADLLERLAEPELQGELIPDRYSGYQKTVYRDGFHAGYKHGLTCARAALDEPETSPMTIEEIQAAKLKLESTISKLLSQFSSETGTVVSNVDIERLMRHGAPTLYVVQLEVKL